jgi:hypothetical protein
MNSTDHDNLQYVGSFKSGRVFAQTCHMPSYRRLERLRLVVITTVEPHPKRWPGRYRSAVSLTDAGRALLELHP